MAEFLIETDIHYSSVDNLLSINVNGFGIVLDFPDLDSDLCPEIRVWRGDELISKMTFPNGVE